MNYINLENSLRAFTFSCLFLTMLFYWIKASFFSVTKGSFTEVLVLAISNISLMVLLVLRWIDAKHFPLSNLYESLIFLCWSLNSFLIWLQIKFKENSIGILISPIILFINTFATFSLPIEMQKASSLVPALQSNWLMMHVTIMMLSYAALMLGSLLSIAFLVILFVNKKNLTTVSNVGQIQTWSQLADLQSLEDSQKITNSSEYPNSFESQSTSMTAYLEDKNIKNREKGQQVLIEKLDNLSYRMLGIGFPLLTIGILSGAVWANETWGSYWSWDPKETWALITWFIYAIYLHSRIIKGWKGEKPALIASFGFLAVWVCYLGVNIFGKGLHSYGWFS